MRKILRTCIAVLGIIGMLTQSVFAFSRPLGPTARLNVNLSIGSVETPFVFDASQSIDANGASLNLQYHFSFDDSSDFTAWQINPKIVHQYTTKGMKRVMLEVQDDRGRIDRTSTYIQVDSGSLSGNFSVDKTEGDLTTEFKFFATMFTAGGESDKRFEFRWDFNGDGIFDTAYTGSAVTSHIYSTSGIKTPILEVRDPSGKTLKIVGYKNDSKEIGQITVATSRVPEAAISVFPKFGDAKITVFRFDATGSHDETGSSSVLVRYDFENDGEFDTDWTEEKKVTHVYQRGGTQEALVQIKSQKNGQTDTAIISVEVYEKNSRPTAVLEVSNNANSGDPLSGTINTKFSFNALGSHDLEDDNGRLKARFDFNSDGQFDTEFGVNKIITHQYYSVGEKKVTLEVEDSDGNRAQTTKTITIVENEAPRAELTIQPISGTPGTKFRFDVLGAEDSQNLGAYIQTRIDYDGDGAYDTNFNAVKVYNHIYDEAGIFTPKIEVKDRFGNVITVSGRLVITQSEPPVAFFTVEPLSGNFSTNFSVDASGSTDAETQQRKLKYRWDYDYTGTNDIRYDTGFTSNPKNFHQFSGETGERRIRLEVEDEDGNHSSVVKSINLHWASPYLLKLSQRGILNGANGDVKPDEYITRAELIKIIINAARLQQGYEPFVGYFSDVDSNDWHWTFIERAKKLALIEGYADGTFKPDSKINRAEALKIILKAFKKDKSDVCEKSFADVRGNEWFYPYLCTATNLRIVSGYDDGKFHPERNVTRAETAKIVSLLMEY